MRAEVNFACATCGNGLVLPLAEAGDETRCGRCRAPARLQHGGDAGPRTRCAACGCLALYVQRDFNRLLGLGVVAVAAVLAVPTRGISLVVAAIVDLALYRLLPRITVCYACDAIHRGVPVHADHGGFDHHVQDRYKVEKSRRRVAAQAWRREHGA